jgi:hypothetical protein
MRQAILLDKRASGGREEQFVSKEDTSHWIDEFPEGHEELYLSYWTSPQVPGQALGLLSVRKLSPEEFSGGIVIAEQIEHQEYHFPCFFLLEDNEDA